MHATHSSNTIRCDIFCTVIDNFGDIGVCWRLARQLATEHSLQMRLWVDDLASFQRICPELNPSLTQQIRSNIDIRHWSKDFTAGSPLQPAEIVIEAFGCTLPECYVAAMAMAVHAPVWINLDYLSAEPWVSGCHGLSSPHPYLPLIKHFFFPGFTSEAGGLLREAGLLQQRKIWQADQATSCARHDILSAASNELSLSLFCYDNPMLPSLLDAWVASPTPLRCLVPEGRAVSQIADWLRRRGLTQALPAGTKLTIDNLKLQVVPFVRQEAYDHLLWSCDINFVRGEDSFIRAQWAARPCIWQIYPQSNATHHAKLEAFLDLYCSELNSAESVFLRSFWRMWNGIDLPNTTSRHLKSSDLWAEFLHRRPALTAHAEHWANNQATQDDLSCQLMRFCKKLL